MPAEPTTKRAIAFFDGQNLFYAAKEAFGLFMVFRNRWKELLGAELFIGLTAFVISLVAHRIIEDPRPFVVSGVQPLIQSSTDNGFPSDHTLLLAATAAVVLIVSRGIGLLGMLAAFAVGMARVYTMSRIFSEVLLSLPWLLAYTKA